MMVLTGVGLIVRERTGARIILMCAFIYWIDAVYEKSFLVTLSDTETVILCRLLSSGELRLFCIVSLDVSLQVKG
jgi:hypothetical protein